MNYREGPLRQGREMGRLLPFVRAFQKLKSFHNLMTLQSHTTMSNNITDGLDFHAKALMLRSERQRLIASNIANADTPGYVAREIDFPAALARMTGAQTGGGTAGGSAGFGGGNAGAPSMMTVSLNATSAGHIGGANGSGAMADVAAQATWALSSQPSADRNTVDMDRERASFSDNAVHYESTLRFMNFHIRTLLSAIQGQ
jgi:flagellar basal-body rod protein FlgB